MWLLSRLQERASSYTYTDISCAHRPQTYNWPLFYDVLQVNCCAYAVLIENLRITFISKKWKTAMTSQGHVTTAVKKEYTEGHFLSTCMSKCSALPFFTQLIEGPKQYDVKV